MSARTGVEIKGISPYLFILPIAIGASIFGLGAFAYVVKMSFTETSLLKSEYVGLRNYIEIFQEKWLWLSLCHTLYYAAWLVPLNLIIALSLSFAVFRVIRGGAIFRSIYLLPWVSSMVIVGLLFRYMFNAEWGIVNWCLQKIGFSKVLWTESPLTAIPVVAFMEGWRSMGFGMIIFLGAMSSIDIEIIEAAQIEGANWFQRARHIVVPLVKPAIFFYTTISLLTVFQTFDNVYAFVEGIRSSANTDLFISPVLVSSYVIYIIGFRWFEFGKASAMAICLFFVALSIILMQRHLLTRGGGH